MASDAIRAFWNDGVNSERERVLLRIQQGTKASSPHILNKQRLNPGFYFNPLPDNSSGSKIRPFDLSKDESGRPNAMMKVAMRQRGEMPLTGGVLKDYRYARNILDRRVRDVKNLDLEAQGLPAQPEPIASLTEVDSRNLELNTLLQNLIDVIGTGAYTQLTINDLKGIPRLLISVIPTYTEDEITQLIQGIEDDILVPLRDTDINRPVATTIIKFFDKVMEYLRAMVQIANSDEATKRNASITIGKRIFGSKVGRLPENTAVREQGEREQMAMEDVDVGPGPPAPPMPPAEEQPAEEQPAPQPAQPRPRPQIGPGAESLRLAFRQNNTDYLEAYIRRALPNLRAEKYFRSRTTMANVIQDRLGINIK